MPNKTGRLKNTKRHVLAGMVIFAGLWQPGSTKDNYIMDTNSLSNGPNSHGSITSDQMLELGTSSSSALRLEGEQSMRFNNVDRAIMVLQKSVEMSPHDMDGRILYSEALEKKLLAQKDRDPSLYNFVIKQWLYVSKKAEFMDQSKQGAEHLANLTGARPGKFENPARYLSRVLIPEDGSVKVAFRHKKSTPTE